MKNVKTIDRDLYDLEVEKKIQQLTKYAYITQADIARICGCASNTVKKELMNLGITSNAFGYPTSKVIKALELGPYLDNLIKLRKSSRA